MAEAFIPVDLFNPGQVFACLGFLEAAEALFGEAEGGFEWSRENGVQFQLKAKTGANPFGEVMAFLATAEIERSVPHGYVDPPATKSKKRNVDSDEDDEEEGGAVDGPLRFVDVFPAPEAEPNTLPLRLRAENRTLDVGYWADGSSRNPFKLFAGKQRGPMIARSMLSGVAALWNTRRDRLIAAPFEQTISMGGSSFKLDARKAWTAIDAGYSPDKQGHGVAASPIVEILGAIGLEHARPSEEGKVREVRYAAWLGLVPAPLARPLIAAARVSVPIRSFRFVLSLSGKNKVVTYAKEEIVS